MMKKRDMIVIAIELVVILVFIFFFYFNNKAVGATFLLPGTTHFESCWQRCEFQCQFPCLEECCLNDQECFEDIQISCPDNEVIKNG